MIHFLKKMFMPLGSCLNTVKCSMFIFFFFLSCLVFFSLTYIRYYSPRSLVIMFSDAAWIFKITQGDSCVYLKFSWYAFWIIYVHGLCFKVRELIFKGGGGDHLFDTNYMITNFTVELLKQMFVYMHSKQFFFSLGLD